jgi:hypothetical protein
MRAHKLVDEKLLTLFRKEHNLFYFLKRNS